MGLFGATKVDPKKQVNEMQSVLRRETRAIDRQIRDIERQQEKTKNMLKQNAKKGDKAACRILAKEIVNSKKAVSRMYQSKAQLNSVMVSFSILFFWYFSEILFPILDEYENSVGYN